MAGASLALAAGVRLALLALALGAGFSILNQPPSWSSLAGQLNRWDAPHFISIAQNGYLASGEERLFIVFFPLFPLAVSLVHFFIRDFVASGLIVSFAASGAAGFFLQALVRLDFDAHFARRALFAFFLFPTAYFLALPYTEALFLASAIASVYFARKGNWMHAGVAGFLATLCRVHGLALFPALALEAWLQLNGGKLVPRRLPRIRPAALLPFAWILLVPLGFAAYLALNATVLGSPLAFLEIQRVHWHHSITLPFEFFASGARALSTQPLSEFNALVFLAPLAALAVAAAILLASAKWMRPSYQLYSWAVLLPSLVDSWPISLPRYVLGIFPLFIAIAAWTRDARVRLLVFAASGLLMAGLFVLYSIGRWAF